jgi:zinc transport system permease protein
MDDFVVRALAAAIGVALVSGPLGCVVVWRRMAYFGATLAHAALLGVALGILLDVNMNLGILAVCVAISALLVGLQGEKRLATDTLLGILAHGALALGLVVLSFAEGLRIDLMAYLFGDVLAVTWEDLIWVYGGGALVLGVLAAIWRRLLFVTVHAELAQVSGVPAAPVRLAFMILIAAVTAVAMKIVGVLLIVSMLIIPAAAARRFAVTPEQMAVIAAVLGCLAAAGGIAASVQWDTPAGPSIVSVAAILFFVSQLAPPRGARPALRPD